MKSHILPNRVFWRLDLATGLSHEFKPRVNSLASLGLLSCSATVGATLQLLTCLVRVHHSGGLQSRATREIQLRVPVSFHNLEQFFTLSHILPLHDSHLNTWLLIAKIRANLVRNKANKMIDKIQPYINQWGLFIGALIHSQWRLFIGILIPKPIRVIHWYSDIQPMRIIHWYSDAQSRGYSVAIVIRLLRIWIMFEYLNYFESIKLRMWI